jgi:hypothetical protein
MPKKAGPQAFKILGFFLRNFYPLALAPRLHLHSGEGNKESRLEQKDRLLAYGVAVRAG